MSQTVDEHAFQLQIINSLKDTNMHESQRSVMRLKLIEKLNRGKTIPDLSARTQKPALTLIEKITASLIFQFLKQKGFTMTMSIFEPEVGENLFLEETQILSLMVKGTESYKEKIMQSQKKKSTSIQDFIISSHFKGDIGLIDSGTQTYNEFETFNLDEKLCNIFKIFFFIINKNQQDQKTYT